MNPEELPGRARWPRPGDPRWIGAYEVLGFLGEGGMGSVFLGRGRDGTLVAIKVVRPELADEPSFRARFRRETVSAMGVPRYSTAEVLAADPDADPPYLVTEFIDAPTLKETVAASGPLRGAELDQLAVAMATALVGIHAAGIVHRDLKPGNVLLSRMGPRVIDFGIAKPAGATRITADDQVLGTPAYMAPEQLRGRPGPASDVFAWGCVMVFAATGRRPFGGTTAAEIARAVLHGEPDLTGLSGRLRGVVAAALSKDPKARPAPAALLEMLGVAAPVPLIPAPGRPGGEMPARAAEQPAGRDAGGTGGQNIEGTRTDQGPRPPGGRMATRSDETSAGDIWPTWTPPKPRKRRRWPAVAATVLLLCGVLAVLYLRGRPALEVTAVSVRPDKARHGCGTTVDLTGTLTTNGASGEIEYQWKRSDQKAPGPRLTENVKSGEKTAMVHLLWRISGPGKRQFTATLMILNPSAARESATFTYNCKSR
ncbi:serine/threonine-protein kinase [Actinomadura fibrosa]|uniref:Serine/threonine-protein kinase n=1 Tax=Actinomadura fibrosa TaxID=111802 RepID=A0ABW2XP50_9ACTN|nr:serine/threonine-protein kinase [Actinomadura fibrosa]